MVGFMVIFLSIFLLGETFCSEFLSIRMKRKNENSFYRHLTSCYDFGSCLVAFLFSKMLLSILIFSFFSRLTILKNFFTGVFVLLSVFMPLHFYLL